MKRPGLFAKVLFMDMILNALVCFIALFMLALLQINPESAKENAIETLGKYAVVVTWPDGSHDDVDLYVRDPAGNVAFFQNRDIGLMHLEHDDLGARSDSMRTDVGDVTVDRNEERVVIRGIVPGEYTVNVHMYRKSDPGQTPVTITLYRLIGNDEAVISKERVLERNGHELTAFRFTLREDESLSGTSELPRRLVGKAPPRSGGPPSGPMSPFTPWGLSSGEGGTP
jgi:hypothetical protein